jgi:hypothetical protein
VRHMDRCDSCRHIATCRVCGLSTSRFTHTGVRGTTNQFRVPIVGSRITYDSQRSGVWHYAQPCQHRNYAPAQPVSANVKYNGGPLWGDGYTWQNIYWGSLFNNATSWIQRVEKATLDIETDPTYSRGLRQYNVGMGKLNTTPVIITIDPPAQLSDSQIGKTLTAWIGAGTVPDLAGKGAYNIFLPPNTTAILSSDRSCSSFCDYHNTVNGPDGPFYTVEPYPCSQGCNQCTSDPFDTLTQGLSEEMVELKTDMDPGSGWVIGNEEICDFCDTNFVCNRISTGEYVNSWYDMNKKACWRGV